MPCGSMAASRANRGESVRTPNAGVSCTDCHTGHYNGAARHESDRSPKSEDRYDTQDSIGALAGRQRRVAADAGETATMNRRSQ